MRLRSAALALTLLGAPPAAASTSLECAGVDADARVSVLLAAGLIRTPLSVSLEADGAERRTVGPGSPAADALVIGQSWLDGTEFRLDLLDVEGREFEARLRVRFLKEGPTLATGTLVLGRGCVLEVECMQG